MKENPNQMFGTARDGLEQLDLNQQVTFTQYKRIVLPLDGFVFWQPIGTVTFSGSLHYSQQIVQDEDQILGLADVTFTSESQIARFRSSPINMIFVANKDNFRYAFSVQAGYYSQIGLWHYVGHSINPAMASQLLDSPDMIDPDQAVTSNSLALWLGLNNYVSPLGDSYSNALDLYPSFQTPPNLVPPYAAVHIDPQNGTRPLQALPNIRRSGSSHQLMADRVKITAYGLQNDSGIDFLNCVLAYSEFTDNFGIMSPPRVLDGKRVQLELETIAMQKIYEFEVSYYQTRVQTLSRKLIEKVQIDIYLAKSLNVPSSGDLSTDSGDGINTDSGIQIQISNATSPYIFINPNILTTEGGIEFATDSGQILEAGPANPEDVNLTTNSGENLNTDGGEQLQI